jgi:hypothetical protein
MKKLFLPVVVAPIGIIISFVVTVIDLSSEFRVFSTLNPEIEGIVIFILGLNFTIALTYAADAFQRKEELDSIKTSISQMRNLKTLVIPDRSDTWYVGTLNKDIIQHVAETLDRAARVKNTYIVAVDDKPFDPKFNYETVQRPKIVENIKNFLSKGDTHWFDICSRNVSYENEASFAGGNIKPRPQAVWDNLDQGSRERYHPKILERDFPFPNFIIFEDEGGQPFYVLFGFGLHPKEGMGNIFGSRDPHLLTTFALHFDSLSEYCVDWNSAKQ